VGSGVDPARVGERVWTWNAQWKRAFGTAAEYVVLPSALAVRLPDHVGFAEGACLGIPAMTAYHAVATAQANSASTVLIAGGAGGVGHYAIQFAKARGAVVITTVSSDAKAKLALAAGADHVIDYKREDVAAAVTDLTDNAGVDAVIEMDLAANARLYPGLLHPRSRVVVYGTGAAQAKIPAQFLLVNAITLEWIFVYELTAEERAAAIGAIAQGMAQKQLIHNVALSLPLAEVVRAHEAVEQGAAAGSVVVTIP
jgi:NADPH2:quinone reductase